MQVAHVLTYHSGNIAGNDYPTNDLVALREDLSLIRALGLAIVPLRAMVDALVAGDCARLPERVVAITLDDGLDFDFVDLEHPFHGPQRSAHRVLREFGETTGAFVHATSFVIASPDARQRIADREMLGYRWINDAWWPDAVRSGALHIGNHSWDHASPSAPASPASTPTLSIDDLAAADLQVRQAREHIERVAANPGAALFAFPYGRSSDYLIKEYLPDASRRHGTVAAFTTCPCAVTPSSDRWTLPRFTCGADWRSPETLAALLR